MLSLLKNTYFRVGIQCQIKSLNFEGKQMSRKVYVHIKNKVVKSYIFH